MMTHHGTAGTINSSELNQEIEREARRSFREHAMEPTYQAWSVALSLSMIPISAFGLIASFLILHINLRLGIKLPVNFLLASLAVADAGNLFFGALAFVPLGLSDSKVLVNTSSVLKPLTAYCVKWIYPVALTFQTATIYVLVMITVERFFAVCRPLYAKILISFKNEVIGLLLIAFVSIVFNLPRFFENELVHDSDGSLTYKTSFKKNFGSFYTRLYTCWLYLIFMFAFPFFLLIVFNIRIVMALRKSKRFRNRSSSINRGSDDQKRKRYTDPTQINLMLFIVTLIFLLSSVLPFALRAYDTIFQEKSHALLEAALEINRKDKNSRIYSSRLLLEYFQYANSYPKGLVSVLTSIGNLLVCISSASNFPIYYFFNSQFRAMVWELPTYFRRRRREEFSFETVDLLTPLQLQTILMQKNLNRNRYRRVNTLNIF